VAVRRGQATASSQKFLRLFGKPERLLSCDCERSDATTLAQALQLITGDLLNDAVRDPDNRVGRLLKAGQADRAIVEELFLATLTRRPTDHEGSALAARVEAAPDRRAALEDVLWALLNSKEFLLRK
jgi:hypothetical protein